MPSLRAIKNVTKKKKKCVKEKHDTSRYVMYTCIVRNPYLICVDKLCYMYTDMTKCYDFLQKKKKTSKLLWYL